MAEVHACSIEYSIANPLWGRWGGQIAVYDVMTDSQGAVTGLKRRIIEGREHLPPLVKLEQFEKCVRRWRFDRRGKYEVLLIGGPVGAGSGDWVIDVRRDNQVFRLRLPFAKSSG